MRENFLYSFSLIFQTLFASARRTGRGRCFLGSPWTSPTSSPQVPPFRRVSRISPNGLPVSSLAELSVAIFCFRVPKPLYRRVRRELALLPCHLVLGLALCNFLVRPRDLVSFLSITVSFYSFC